MGKFGQTPQALGIKKGIVSAPKGGWKECTWYLVDVAYNNVNPIHRSLFYSGFLDEDEKWPAGYNQLVSTDTPGSSRTEITDVFYLKVVKKLFTSRELENAK